MRMLFLTLASAVSLTCMSSLTLAKEVDPTGTWKWTVMAGNNQTHEFTLKLKLDDGKLTGILIWPDEQETAVEDGSYKDDELAFSVKRDRGGQKFVVQYKGKVTDDTIK